MPRYEVALVLTLDANSQHEAAEMADQMVADIEDGVPDELNGTSCPVLPPGDSSLRIVSISWPVD